MSAKKSKATAATSTKVTRPKRAAGNASIVVPIPKIGTPEDVKRSLCPNVPGWDDLTEDQQTELAELAQAHLMQRQPVRVTVNRKSDGGNSIGVTGECETLGLLKLQKTFAAVSMDPVNARASELLKYLGSVGSDNADRYNAALSFIESMEPQNQAEVLLLVQMYVAHDASIRAISQLGKADWVPNMNIFGNLAAKLMRTFQGQMDTLQRMRRGGEQVVRHIHVDNRGGQAVIAETVHTGGREHGKPVTQAHEQGACGTALPGQDASRYELPVAGHEREGAV